MGQKIIGDPTRPTNDVALAKNQERVGDSLSVHLSQHPRSAAVWTLQIWVHVQQGSFILGQDDTVAPTAGAFAARTVVIANCPGATGWRVVATCPTAGEEAELTLDSSKCCANVAGVRFLDTGGEADEDVNIVSSITLPVQDVPWTEIFSTALSNSFVIDPTPGTLRSITVRVDSTLATGTYYLQLWNAAAPPVDGTAVTLVTSLAAPEKVVHILGTDQDVRYDFDEGGIPYTVGASLGLSSTEFTKTAVAGAFLSVISAEYR